MDRALPKNWPTAAFAGALVGGALSVAYFSTIGIIGGSSIPSMLVAGAVTFLFATPVWALFIFVLGQPVWGLAHAKGYTSASAAAVIGAITTFVGKLAFTLVSDGVLLLTTAPWQDMTSPVMAVLGDGPLVIDGVRTATGWANEAVGAALLAIAGAVAASVTWWVAYRRDIGGS